MENENNFIGYEYHEISVARDMASVYADAYPNFGWVLESSATPTAGIHSIHMKFKRNRKICNKSELTRLQRQFDASADEIVALEKSKTTTASIVAFSIGLIGCAFMAGSVFSITGAVPHVILCTVLAIPGFIGLILPYFSFSAIRRSKTSKLCPLIEKKYDALYDVCKKANGLLGGDDHVD